MSDGSNSIGTWTPQQLRDFIGQANRDAPQTPGSVQHRNVDVQDTLYVGGQPVVGPTNFPNRVTGTSSKGRPEGVFAGTMDSMSRVNDMFYRSSNQTKYQFYSSYDKLLSNGTFSFGGLVPNIPFGVSVYVPTSGTLSATGVFWNTFGTWPLTSWDCAIYGPWDDGPLSAGLTPTAPLVCSTANPAFDPRNAGPFAGSWYQFGNSKIVEFTMPQTYLRQGVYYAVWKFDGSTGGTIPNWLAYDPTATPLGTSAPAFSYFGESTLGIQFPSTTLVWPGVLPAFSLPVQQIWAYFKMS